MNEAKERNYSPWIILASIAIPVLISLLFYTDKIEGYDFSFLPATYAITNGITALLLVSAVVAIKNKNMLLHKRLMTACIALSIYFLAAYVLYHSTSEQVKFGGDGAVKIVYLIILASHILLSVAIVPLVLITYTRALHQKFDKHKKIARITFPIWLYVAITGVVIYLMISPYYPQ
ncbi:MAG: DUF420 domain-containing protein [Flavobacteriales bacterium]|nr:DUF420 domain-containing protein [Flavobacteriales bacterium]